MDQNWTLSGLPEQCSTEGCEHIVKRATIELWYPDPIIETGGKKTPRPPTEATFKFVCPLGHASERTIQLT